MIKKTVKTKKVAKKSDLKYYFNSGTHAAIVRFQSEDSQQEKERIYVSEILPAFSKLVENLVYIHGTTAVIMSEDFKNDCITFLYETLKKFDASRGTKAFSYFNVVAKNWIIVKSRQRQKQVNRHISIEDRGIMTEIEMVPFDIYKHDPLSNTETIHNDIVEKTNDILQKVKTRLSCENDKVCMDSIIHLFENIDSLESLNKRAIFVYVRDMTNLTPKQLSSSMSSIRKHYREISKLQIF
jgi:hypothetical protein